MNNILCGRTDNLFACWLTFDMSGLKGVHEAWTGVAFILHIREYYA